MSDITDKLRAARQRAWPSLVPVYDWALVIAAEMEEGVRLSTSVLKQLCSTDEVGGEKKYKTPFTFVPISSITKALTNCE
jgi:phage/plasmid-associated DNA primase